jgi:hypothetical protein
MNDIIFSYTRADAIADGILVDVSELAREAGFRIPVAVTRVLWGQCIEVSEDDDGQDETGRLWDILNILHMAARGPAGNRSILFFDVLIAKGGKPPKEVRLKSHIGPGDDGKPVVTVMLPDED